MMYGFDIGGPDYIVLVLIISVAVGVFLILIKRGKK